MSRNIHSLMLVGAAMASLATPAQAGTASDIVEAAVQRDVTLTPPVGQPYPAVGAFVRLYSPQNGEPADPNRVGTYEVAPSACSELFGTKTIKAVDKRSEVWRVSSGSSASVGIPAFKAGAEETGSSVLGIEYNVVEKVLYDGGVEAVTECCLKRPDACTDRYVSEVWRGSGSLYSIDQSKKGVKAALRLLPQVTSAGFHSESGWNRGSEWPEDMFFAFRMNTLSLPSCKAYMNDLSEVEGKVLFTGISARVESEQMARRDARDDATQQLVRYLGSNYKISGDSVEATAASYVKGIKDSLTCLDDIQETVEGPMYLARVRMYVAQDALDKMAKDGD